MYKDYGNVYDIDLKKYNSKMKLLDTGYTFTKTGMIITDRDNLEALECIIYPKGVIVMSCWEGVGLTNLKEIITSKTLRIIGQQAYSKCEKLCSIEFKSPELKVIKSNAFQSCVSLEDIDLSNCKELEEIDDGAFEYCKNIKNISLPDSIKYLGGLNSVIRDNRDITVRVPKNGRKILKKIESKGMLISNEDSLIWVKAVLF